MFSNCLLIVNTGLELPSEEQVTRRNLRLTDKRSGIRTVYDHYGPELCSIQSYRNFLEVCKGLIAAALWYWT